MDNMQARRDQDQTGTQATNIEKLVTYFLKSGVKPYQAKPDAGFICFLRQVLDSMKIRLSGILLARLTGKRCGACRILVGISIFPTQNHRRAQDVFPTMGAEMTPTNQPTMMTVQFSIHYFGHDT